MRRGLYVRLRIGDEGLKELESRARSSAGAMELERKMSGQAPGCVEARSGAKQPGPPGRLYHMARSVFLLLAIVAIGCGSSIPSALTDVPPSAPLEETAVSALITDLRDAGASVAELGPFETDPLGGRGAHLCVAGQEISAYVFPKDDEASSIAQTIDPRDPSKIRNDLIVEWAGNPKFWHRGPVIVLYLGSNPATEAGLTSVLGPPFAAGLGRDPGAAAHGC